ncbi:(2Fe-2S)-binding protein [Acuticoccus mangrovi]|uniref:(2Fe-2S)-binding protein n=1 Tax=Acuticoccus mangrovi TaxID=2796142 RepID=A0A934MFQ5_9HYPH|nr:(2Fe-2S)-binding protein [Acuticoccus mangrovi]MBJ3775180.1 (2Fe-2S)-binding protein [Acuticoccus mangrovi]
MAQKPIRFTHNGAERAVFVEEGANLLDVLRRGVGDLTPKYGCGQGTCGACTVIVDGAPRLSCLTLAETVDGGRVDTVAGLAEGNRLSALQEAFMSHFAAQCGYCTDGMLMSATALLKDNPRPTREEVVEAISGNLCRCTGYEAIIEAILTAAGSGGARRAG